MILTCVVTMLGPVTSSPMINWLKNRPFSIANLLLGETGCWLQIEVRWRRLALRCLLHITRASWQIVLDSWQQTFSRIAQTQCTHLAELLVHRANQWASMDVCNEKRGRSGFIMNHFHSGAAIATKRQRLRREGGGRILPRSRQSHSDCRGCLHPDIGHFWDLDQRRNGTEPTLKSVMENGTKLQK